MTILNMTRMVKMKAVHISTVSLYSLTKTSPLPSILFYFALSCPVPVHKVVSSMNGICCTSDRMASQGRHYPKIRGTRIVITPTSESDQVLSNDIYMTCLCRATEECHIPLESSDSQLCNKQRYTIL